MTIQVRCVDTDIVIPVATRLETGKLRDTYYKVELVSDFPELGISVSLGVQATLTPKEDKPGFKSKGVLDVIYRPLLTVRFNKQMQPSLDVNPLLSQQVSTNGAVVYVYEGEKREPKDYPNHLSLINDYILPQALSALLSPKYKSAQFSSWLYVGLLLLDQVQNHVEEEGEGFKQSLKPLTEQQVLDVVMLSHSTLLKEQAYVSNSHKLIAEKLKARLPQATPSK